MTTLPRGATKLMRVIEQITEERFAALEASYEKAWNPATCRSDLLPYLAWTVDVFWWDPAWTEEEKRRVISWTVRLRKIRGTLGAVRQGLLPLGIKVDVIPWWQEKAEFELGKDLEFRVYSTINDNLGPGMPPVDARKNALIRDIVDSLKPLKARYTIRNKVDFTEEVACLSALRVTKVYKTQAEIEVTL